MLFWLLWQKLLSQGLLSCKLLSTQATINSNYWHFTQPSVTTQIPHGKPVQYCSIVYPTTQLSFWLWSYQWWACKFFVFVHNSQIFEFLGSFRNRKSFNFLCATVCKSQIHKFIKIILQIRKFPWCPSLHIPNPQNCKEKGSVSDPDPHWICL